MNRADKIAKLAHAVKEWRGVSQMKTGKWLKLPRPAAARRVEKWVFRLGLPMEATMKRLFDFESYSEFHEWLGSI